MARTGSTGDARFCQVNTTLPANLYTQPWVNTALPPPTYTITDDLFLVPDVINVSLTGTYETYVAATGQPGNTAAVSIALSSASATQVAVSNLPADAFKVIVGVSPSAVDNSLWFFIRVFNNAGQQITTFTTPITVAITTSSIMGPTATVELNGSTLTTTATEVSPGVYQFSLSSNSEYLITAALPATNAFPAIVGPSLLAVSNVIVYTSEAVTALVNGDALPVASRVSWAPDGMSAGSLFKKLGRKAVVYGPAANMTHVFIQVQVVNGPVTEGVGGDAGDYLCGWICTWAANGAAPVFA